MNAILEKLKKWSVILLSILVVIGLCIPIIFFVIYLKSKGKTLQIIPGLAIVDADKKTPGNMEKMENISNNLNSMVSKIK
jgi:hypothetical protein